jgi:hypothetical protein
MVLLASYPRVISPVYIRSIVLAAGVVGICLLVRMDSVLILGALCVVDHMLLVAFWLRNER